MSAIDSANKLIDDFFMKTVTLDAPTSPFNIRTTAGKVIAYLAKVAKMLLVWLMQPKNWLKKRTWIGAFILLRAAYVTMNEYGKNPFKKSLNKDHVFLTGAGSGLGRLMAVRLGKLGCKLSLSDINMAGLEETRALCKKEGVPEERIAIFVCDVSKKESILKGAQSARAAHGLVTLLINNAGIVSGKSTLELTDAMIEKTMQVNTIAHLHTIREFLPDMIQAKRGHIVTIASMAGLAGVPGLSDYCGSKYGAIGIDEAVRTELIQKGLSKFIKTSCICPYLVSTGLFDGAKKSFPFSILSPVETVDRIIAAIQQEEPLVVIPWRGNMVFLAKMLPVGFQDNFSRVIGLHN